MKKISSALFDNLGWKLISLLLAAILWFICINVNNPAESRFFDVPLTLENERKIAEDGYVLLNEAELKNRRVSVRVRASRNTLAELVRKQSNIRALIDLSPIDILSQSLGTPQSVTVLLEIPLSVEDYDITYQSPTKMNVVIDRYVTEPKNIEVDRKGEAAEGYISGKAEIDPVSINITGAQSVLSQIGSVRVQADLSGATTDVEAVYPVAVYDNSGKNITNQIKLEQEGVYVRVPVSKYARIPISTPRINGNVTEGYVLTNVSMEPTFVEVVGSDEEIAQITGIDLPPINISGYTETRKQSFDLRQYLPYDNVAIRNNTPHEAVITVVIERESIRELTVLMEKMQILGMNAAVDWTATEVTLVVRGAEGLVDSLDPDSLYGTLNLSGLAAGRHRIAVQFELPEGVNQIGESSIEINIAESTQANQNSPEEILPAVEQLPAE